MLFFVLGLPGRFADWCERVTTELARLSFGPMPLLHADTLEDLGRSALTAGATEAVVSSRQPGARLCGALAQHRRNFVLALDDPGPALADLVLRDGHELAAAVRAVAGSCGALIDQAAAPGALVLWRERDWPQPDATVAAIARHLQLALPAEALAGFGAAAMPPAEDAGAWWDGLSAAERAMAAGAIQPFIRHRESGELPPLRWTHGLFFDGERPERPPAGPVDITGRARCLLSGPAIMLPPGVWSLSLTMSFSGAAAEHEFLVDLAAGPPVGAGIIRPQHRDEAEMTLDFVLGETTERPLVLRVSSLRAAFDGAIAIVEARLQRITAFPTAAAPPTAAGA